MLGPSHIRMLGPGIRRPASDPQGRSLCCFLELCCISFKTDKMAFVSKIVPVPSLSSNSDFEPCSLLFLKSASPAVWKTGVQQRQAGRCTPNERPRLSRGDLPVSPLHAVGIVLRLRLSACVFSVRFWGRFSRFTLHPGVRQRRTQSLRRRTNWRVLQFFVGLLVDNPPGAVPFRTRYCQPTVFVGCDAADIPQCLQNSGL